MSDRLQPQTAREALFEIRRRSAEVHADTDAWSFACEVDRVALEGIGRREPINFELSDSLADRLAESHRLLRSLRRHVPSRTPGSSTDRAAIEEALGGLPRDLQAMVERRIGPDR